MKVLFVTPQLPAPPAKGTTLRNFHLVRDTAARHEVRVLSITHRDDDLAAAPSLGVPVVTVPAPNCTRQERLLAGLRPSLPDLAARLHSPVAAAAFQEMARAWRPDVVVFEALESAGAVGWRPGWRGPRFIYDAHNAEFALQDSLWRSAGIRPLRAAYSWDQARRLRGYEAALCREAAGVVAVSQADSDRLRALSGVRPVVVPNAIDVARYQSAARDPADPPALLFLGTLSYRPNVEGLRWFAAKVLPRVRREVRRVRLWVVGRDPSPAVHALASAHVDIVGTVVDERPWLARAAAMIAPMRSGGGMRFKIAQAMAARAPLVSTSFGVEGIAVRHGEHALLADDPAAFAHALVRLLRFPAETHERTERAAAFAVERLDWSGAMPPLRALLARLES